GASRFTYATACQVARPPSTDRTRSPRPQRAFTSRLPAVWSPSLPLGITTTWTGLLVLAGLAPAGMAASLAAPEPYVQLSCIRLPPRMFDGWPRPSVRAPASVTRFPGTVSGTCGIGSRSPWPPPFAPPPPLPVARPCSAASLLLWRRLTSHALASSASVPHLPDAGQSALQPVAGHETSQVRLRGGFGDKSRFRSGLPAGGRRIRTLGPSSWRRASSTYT